MSYRKRIFALVFICLAGCSGLIDKAKKYYDAEEYEDAANLYQQVLAEHPDNEDAIIGLKKSREKLVDSKLIEIRMSRLAGNAQNSADMLLKIVLLENEWQFYPKGKVAFTQEEESNEALNYVLHQVRSLDKKRLPLAAQVVLDHYKPIFQGSLQKENETLESEILKVGQSKCKELSAAAGPSRPYFSLFTKSFCSKWGVEGRNLAHTSAAKSSELFNGISVKTHLKGLPNEVNPLFQEALESSFKKTAWFDTEGSKKASIDISVNFVRKNQEAREQKVHEYTVQIPYTAYVPAMRTREVPYQTTQYTCVYGYNGRQICGNVPATAYHTEYYTVMEPQTRFRTEPRTQIYDGLLKYQLMLFGADGLLVLGKTQQKLSVTEKSEVTGFEHSWNMPDIGLMPESANLPDPLDWVRSQVSTLANELETKANNTWEALYCKPLEARASIAQQGEQVHRCARLKKEALPQFAEYWYRNAFGISLDEANSLIGLRQF